MKRGVRVMGGERGVTGGALRRRGDRRGAVRGRGDSRGAGRGRGDRREAVGLQVTEGWEGEG